jgi:hypothetical protein
MLKSSQPWDSNRQRHLRAIDHKQCKMISSGRLKPSQTHNVIFGPSLDSLSPASSFLVSALNSLPKRIEATTNLGLIRRSPRLKSAFACSRFSLDSHPYLSCLVAAAHRFLPTVTKTAHVRCREDADNGRCPGSTGDGMPGLAQRLSRLPRLSSRSDRTKKGTFKSNLE